MGIVIRQSLKASFVTYFGVAIGSVNQLWVATKILTEAELGLTRSLFMMGLLFYSIFNFGGPSIADRYFSRFRDDEARHHGFLTFLLLYTGFYFLLYMAVYFGGKAWFTAYYQEKSPELVDNYFLLVWLTGFNLLQGVLESYCRNLQRIAVPAVLREVIVKLANMGVIIAYGLHWIDFETFVTLYVLSYGLISLGLLVYLAGMGKLYLSAISWDLVRPVLKDMIRFGGVAALGAVGTSLCKYLDQSMIGHYQGQREAGIFFIAYLIASMIEIPRKSLTQIAIPLVAQSLMQEDYASTQNMHRKVALHQLLAGLFLFVGIWTSLGDLFGLMPKGDVFREGTMVVLLFSLTSLLDMSGGMSSEIMGYSRYYKVSTALVLLLGVANIALNHVLIPAFGFTGAAMATAITITSYSIARGAFVWWKFRIVPFSGETLRAAGVGLAAYAASFLVPDFGHDTWTHLLGIALRGSVVTLVFATLLIYFRISPEVNGLFATVMKRVRRG